MIPAFLTRRAQLCLLAGALTMVACGESTPPAQKKAANAAKGATGDLGATAAPATGATAVTAPVEYTYDVTIRDPFKPIIPGPRDQEGAEDCGPLCQYDISQFRINGIIWGISQPAAMLRAPDGKPYIIKVGTPIGRNKGKVVSITKDRIAVLEKYVNYRGEVVTNRVDIELPSEGGSKK